MINDQADEIIEKLLNGYQIELQISKRDKDFIFDCVHLLQMS